MTSLAGLPTTAANAIIMVAAGELFAGAERQILALLVYLRADGFRPTLVLFHDRELARRARALDIDVAIVPGDGPFRKAAIRQIARLVRERQAGVVHFHGYKAALHVALARRQTPFETVATIHGAPEFSGPLSGRLRSWVYAQCERIAIRTTRARVVFVTAELARKLPRLSGGAPHEVILNGIDPQTVASLSRPPELESSHFNVVVVGRLEIVKGVTFAIQALQDSRIPSTVRLWIVGDGPERAALAEQVSSAGLAGRVVFTGFRTDAVAFTANADLLLMPSLHEGLPYTMLEAIAASAPIAASRVGGLAETLQDQHTALLFPPGDPAGIATIIVNLAADPALGRKIAQRAHSELFPRFSAALMARGYEEVYTRLSWASSRPASP